MRRALGLADLWVTIMGLNLTLNTALSRSGHLKVLCNLGKSRIVFYSGKRLLRYRQNI